MALIFATLDADKAEDILVIDLRGKSALTDYMVIATGSSSRQVSALAERLAVKIKEIGGHVTAEGLSQGDWVLLDAGDAVVHLFRPEVRAFYNLEKIWGESLPVAKTGSSS
ncbi:MAG: ribosome silencing factor [Alphaproteobacteria bacterium RIFOXYD12_FULL_60_8]|nr:MAG: ribosome silencing factor [Alphaproteobacteria bacterium RIFOXYD12_FULL_60_8]